MNCPLCLSQNINVVPNKKWSLHKCNDCSLLFKNKKHFVSIQKEKARYEEHKNYYTDQGYQKFLLKSWNLFKNKVNKEDQGLDLGCGPEPVLAQLIQQQGYNIDFYDPYYYPKSLKEKYRYLISTEVFEHFINPAQEIPKIIKLVELNGLISIKTEFYDLNKLNNWYYLNDPTHVVFYNKESLKWIAKKYKLKILFIDQKNLVLFEKK